MQFEDSLPQPHGHFQVWVYRAGVLVPDLCMDEPNLIVTLSKTTLAHLIGGDVSNRSITQLGYGTSGTAATTADTALSGPPFLKAVDATSYPAAGQVKFDFSLSPTENNGMAINEFGLLTAGGVLFSRKVRSAPLNKDSELSFAGSWTLTF